MITYRLLPPDEWSKLIEVGVEPFATFGLPNPAHWRIGVAEDEGRVVGASAVYEAVHNDPWWIAPGYRTHPTLPRRLWETMKGVLDAHGVTEVFVTVPDSRPEVQAMVERMGYLAAPGKLYVMQTAACSLNKE